MNIFTRRLTIRPFEFADWPVLQSIARDFQASEYRYFDREMPTEEARVQSAARWCASTGLWFSVCLAGRMIGYICLHEENGALDLGYSFLTGAHGFGYAFESISALMELLESAGAARFTAGTALANRPSVRLLERLGFRLTGTEEICFYEGHPFEGGLFELDLSAGHVQTIC